MYFEYFYVAAQPPIDPKSPDDSEFSISNVQKWIIKDLINILTKPQIDVDLSRCGYFVKYFPNYVPKWDISSYVEDSYTGTIVSKSTNEKNIKYITISTDMLPNTSVTASSTGTLSYPPAISIKFKIADKWGNTSGDIIYKIVPSGGTIYVATDDTHLALYCIGDNNAVTYPIIISDFQMYDHTTTINYAEFVGLDPAQLSNIWGISTTNQGVYPGNLYSTFNSSSDNFFTGYISAAVKSPTNFYMLDSDSKVIIANYASNIYINRIKNTSDYHIGGDLSSKCGIYAMPPYVTPTAPATAATSGIALEEIIIGGKTYVVWPLNTITTVASGTKRLLVRK